jgi:hypothetical protein
MSRGSSVDAIGDAACRAAGSLYGPHQLSMADRNALESLHERLKPFGPLYRAQAVVGELVQRVAVDDLEQLADGVGVALTKARIARKGTLAGVLAEPQVDEPDAEPPARTAARKALANAKAEGNVRRVEVANRAEMVEAPKLRSADDFVREGMQAEEEAAKEVKRRLPPPNEEPPCPITWEEIVTLAKPLRIKPHEGANSPSNVWWCVKMIRQVFEVERKPPTRKALHKRWPDAGTDSIDLAIAYLIKSGEIVSTSGKRGRPGETFGAAGRRPSEAPAA